LKAIKLCGMTLSVKYLHKNHGLYWYKRRIPKSLLKHLGGRTYHQKSLETADLAEATQRALKETRHLDELFDALSSNRIDTVISPSIISLLSAKYGSPDEELAVAEISPAGFLGNELEKRWLSSLRSEGESLGRRGAALDAWVESEYRRRDGVTEIARVANASELAFLSRGNSDSPFMTLRDLERLYIDSTDRRSGSSSSRLKSTSVVIKSFSAYLGGEKTLVKTIESKHVQGWVNSIVQGGAKPSTAERMLKQLKAIFRGGLDQDRNYFSKVYVPGLKDYGGQRYSPTISDARRILTELADNPIVVLVALIGCRISEVAGLRRSDVFLAESTPFLRIVDHPGRRLKTAASSRDVPLVGAALSAAAVLSKSQPDSEYFLPCYGGKKTGGDMLGQYVNKKVKAVDERITSHCFRHLLKDLLREAGAHDSLANEIQGHANPGHGAKYGRGFSLRVKADWMSEAYKLLGAD